MAFSWVNPFLQNGIIPKAQGEVVNRLPAVSGKSGMDSFLLKGRNAFCSPFSKISYPILFATRPTNMTFGRVASKNGCGFHCRKSVIKQNKITTISGVTTPTYDNTGNLTKDENNYRFVYDAWNRQIIIKNASDAVITTNSFNGINQNIKVVAGSSTINRTYSDGWQLLEEKSGSNTVTRNVLSPVYVDSLVLRDRDTDANGTLDERLFVIQDENYNVTAIISSSGTVQERYTYTPFGVVTYRDASGSAISSSTKAWVFLHQGGQINIAGDYDFRNRVLSPTLGRWLTNDPLGFSAGDVNTYRYIGNSPLDGLDPTGLDIYMVINPSSAGFNGHAGMIVGPIDGKYKLPIGDGKKNQIILPDNPVDPSKKYFYYISLDGPNTNQRGVGGTIGDLTPGGGGAAYKVTIEPFEYLGNQTNPNNPKAPVELGPGILKSAQLLPYTLLVGIKTDENESKKIIENSFEIINDQNRGYRLIDKNCGYLVIDALEKTGIVEQMPLTPRPNFQYIIMPRHLKPKERPHHYGVIGNDGYEKPVERTPYPWMNYWRK